MTDVFEPMSGRPPGAPDWPLTPLTWREKLDLVPVPLLVLAALAITFIAWDTRPSIWGNTKHLALRVTRRLNIRAERVHGEAPAILFDCRLGRGWMYLQVYRIVLSVGTPWPW